MNTTMRKIERTLRKLCIGFTALVMLTLAYFGANGFVEITQQASGGDVHLLLGVVIFSFVLVLTSFSIAAVNDKELKRAFGWRMGSAYFAEKGKSFLMAAFWNLFALFGYYSFSLYRTRTFVMDIAEVLVWASLLMGIVLLLYPLANMIFHVMFGFDKKRRK